MKKTCVLICGTNRSGKTTTATALLKSFGEVENLSNSISITTNKQAGYISADATHKSTGIIPSTTKELLSEVDLAIVEGMYMGTFGVNCVTTLFQAERQLYVYLYCNLQTLFDRKDARPFARGGFKKIAQKQRQCLAAARKFASIGVTVLTFDTSETPTDVIVNTIRENLNKGV